MPDSCIYRPIGQQLPARPPLLISQYLVGSLLIGRLKIWPQKWSIGPWNGMSQDISVLQQKIESNKIGQSAFLPKFRIISWFLQNIVLNLFFQSCPWPVYLSDRVKIKANLLSFSLISGMSFSYWNRDININCTSLS